jgi:poly-gamma-glutamate capsule biosynthesis protein CapA/YwtB (metallophosphatase superfamily)
MIRMISLALLSIQETTVKRTAYIVCAWLVAALLGGCALPAPFAAPTETPSATPTATASLIPSETPTSTSTETPLPTETPTATATPFPGPVHIIAVGDVMLGRQVFIEMIDRKDFTWPFLQTADILRQADLTLGNLEGPIVSYCQPSDGGDVLCGDPRVVEGLTFAGFDVMSMANNHSHDYGKDAFNGTAKYLTDAGISPVYPGNAVLRDINGLRVGIVAYDDSETEMDIDKAVEEVTSIRSQVDVLIAVLHWGHEYQATASARQVSEGHTLLDAGVDIIIGAHPHWRQEFELYNNRLIFYSLGNFVFDQNWSDQTRKGNVADITIGVDQVGLAITYEIKPIEIFDFGQPAFPNK